MFIFIAGELEDLLEGKYPVPGQLPQGNFTEWFFLLYQTGSLLYTILLPMFCAPVALVRIYL